MTLVDIFNALGDIGWDNVFIVLFLIVLITNLSTEGIKKFFNNIGYESTKARLEKERDEKIKKLEDEIVNLQKDTKQFKDDRVSDRQQSFEKQSSIDKKIDGVQTSLTSMITDLAKTQKEIISKVDTLAEQSRKYQLADMRETLLQAHRYYTSDSTNVLRMWTELEKHAWDEQYDVYVLNKGNGYMQNIIKPEMDKLRVVSLDDYETMAELMSSRTQCKN